MNELHQELAAIMKDAAPSQIPPGKADAPAVPETPSLENTGTIFWGLKSLSLQTDYRHGCSFGKYNNDVLTTKHVVNNISDAIKGVFTYQYAKNNLPSDSIKLHIQVIDNILQLIAKDIDARQLKDYSPESLIAGMHGFLSSYAEKHKK